MNARLPASASVAVALALVLAGGATVGNARADDAFGAFMQNQPTAAARSWWAGTAENVKAPQQQDRVASGARGIPVGPSSDRSPVGSTVSRPADAAGHHGH